MDKTLVLEAMYKAVKESLEWGIDCKDCSHSFHIDGIVAVTEMILNKLEDENDKSLNKLGEAEKKYEAVGEKLSSESATSNMEEYRKLISHEITLTSFTNEDAISAYEKHARPASDWAQWYRNLYLL